MKPVSAPAPRQGLRPCSAVSRHALTRVLWIDPGDGAAGIFRDSPVIARLSSPMDPATVSARTFRIEDGDGVVPGRLSLSPDGRVLIWRGERLLLPGVAHTVVACGLQDARGGELEAHRSLFVPCNMTWSELR